MKIKLLFFFLVLSFKCCLPVYAQLITTVAGNGFPGYSGDGGPSISANFNNPISVALDAAGNMYVADFYNHRIRKISAVTKIVTTIAGKGTAGFSGDGGLAINAEMNNPGDLCLDAAGNIYFIDNQNFRIRKIDATSGTISTAAGNGGAGYGGESILAINAGIHYPNGLAVDANNLYISLFSKQRICKVNLLTGILSTIGGTGSNSYSGDGGPAINASFSYPAGLSISAAGDVYVADCYNSRIRKIDVTGIVTTVAGNGIASFSGDGNLATNTGINLPTGVFVDPAGNIFIADRGNNRIRKVAITTGIISTVAGSGNFGYAGDGGSATSPCVKLADPHKVRVDASGNLYISDQSNSCIRKVDTSPINFVSPTINISAPATTICSGSVVSFNSAVANEGTNPFYQWKKNGSKIGSNSPSYSSSSIANGDIITCELTVNTACGPSTVVSNAVNIVVNSTVIPTITIGTASSAICQGSAITFTATPLNEGTSPLYQWQLNGVDVGTDSKIYTSNALSNADVIRCTITSNAACANPSVATSNTIAIVVYPNTAPAISISTSATNICKGSTVSFTAVPKNCGNNPVYQWKINNNNVGINNSVFTSSSLQNNDVISCAITVDSTLTCSSAGSANSNELSITVSDAPAPVVSISASDNFVCPGTSINFLAVTQNAGIDPTYTWKINGNITGTNSKVYSNSNFSNGDMVRCVLISNNITCPSSPATSNVITVLIKDFPIISIDPLNALVKPGSQVQLKATISGSVSSFHWSPPGLLENSEVLNPLTKPIDSTRVFSLSVVNADGCTNTEQVTIKVLNFLQMPSAFTPNNDGLNDIFRIPPNVPLILSDFSVYDRWGKRVFSTNDITKGWNGKYLDAAFNSGTFVYIINGLSQGKKIFLKGSFMLLR